MIEFIDPSVAIFAAGFLFSFAVVFGVLDIVGMFGKRINGVIGLVFGLFAVFYEPYIQFLSAVLPAALVLFVLIFFIVLVKKAISPKGGSESKMYKNFVPLMAVLALLLVVIGILWSEVAVFLGNYAENMLYIIGVIFIAAIFYIAFRIENNKEGAQPQQ